MSAAMPLLRMALINSPIILSLDDLSSKAEVADSSKQTKLHSKSLLVW